MNSYELNFSLSYLFTGSILFVLGIFVYLQNRKHPLNQAFALYSLSISWWSIASVFMIQAPDEVTATLWDRLCLAGVVFIPATFLHFNFTLLKLHDKRKTFIRICYIVSLLFFLLNLTPFLAERTAPVYRLKHFTVPGIGYYFFLTYYTLAVLYGIYLLFQQLRKVKDVLYKQQLSYVFWGTVIGYSGGSLNFNLVLHIPPYTLVPWGNYLIGMYGIMIAYAIAKYHLLDIRIAFTRAGLLLLVYAIVLGIPFYLAYQARTALLPVFMMFITASLGPLWYRSLQRKAENLLLAEQRRYQKVLLQAASGMAREHNLDRLLRLIVYVVDRTVRIEFAAIFLNDPEEECYRLKAIRDHHKVPKNMTFGYGHPLIRMVKQAKEPLTQEKIAPLLGEFMDKPVSMIIPSFTDGNLTGMLFLGEKRSRQMYTEDDINIFKIMAHQTALAISNCIFVEEFKKSQEKLFAAEKLAAVGGMAEGVAHQIRNRLNQFSVAAGEMHLEIEDYFENHRQAVDADTDLKKSLVYLKDISQSIVSNVKKTAGVITGILNFANVEHQETRFSVFPVSEILPHALELLCVKHQLAAFPLEVRGDADDRVYGVKSQLLECVYNILDNAYEAGKDKLHLSLPDAERATFLPEIRMNVVQKENSTLIAVTDNGVGIRDENKRKIFAPFFTTKPSVSSGTGIGLYVVKRMIEENHKGKIWFESEYLKGTTIYLELPRPRDAAIPSDPA